MSFWNDEVFEEAEKANDFSPIPPGDYTVTLVDSEIKETKAKDGNYLNLRFDVLNGSHEGRVIFTLINVNNKNPKATGIGLGQLKVLAHAAGKEAWYEGLKTCTSWAEAEMHLNSLHNAICNIPIVAKVTVKRDEKYGDKNDIKYFAKAETSVPNIAPAAMSAKKSSPFD